MTDRIVNVPLLRQVLEHITAHPKEHEQGEWAARGPQCGTAYCLAGHALVMAGHQLRWRPAPAGTREVMPNVHEVATSTTDGRPIFNAAMDLLGLNVEQADQLFESDNTLAELWAYAGELTDGEIQRPVTR